MAQPGSGNAGEAMVLGALVARGYDVSIPFGEGRPYDLIIELEGSVFARVQCKTAWPVGGCVVFNSHSTDHGRGAQPYHGLADLFGVFFPPRRSVYLVPIDGVARFEGRLRLDPPRNNQRKGIRFAAEFEIDRWSPESLRALVRRSAPLEEALATVA